MRPHSLLSLLPQALELFLDGIEYGGCEDQIECLMSVWVGDGDYASVLDDLSGKDATSRFTVIRMVL